MERKEERSNRGERERDSKEREKRRREGWEAVRRTGRWKVREKEKRWKVGFWNVVGIKNKEKRFWQKVKKWEVIADGRNLGG